MEIKKVMVLVELDNGHVHQVISSAEKKKICVALLHKDTGDILLSPRVEPVILKPMK